MGTYYVWLLLSIACTVSATGYTSVYIKSSKYGHGQLVTSSTLRWVYAEKGNRPDSAVQATEEIVPGKVIKVLWYFKTILLSKG